MRTVPLTTIKGGIDRLRTKGGARADALYDLVNGYVTEQYTVAARPGTERTALLPSGTVGLTAFDGKLHVFSASDVDTDGHDPEVTLHRLLHPNAASEALAEIHFAEPFLGVRGRRVR